MPAINFPAAPSLNQTFTAGAITYTWDGEKWLAGVAAGAAGATGATGLTGTAGAQGATGATGLTGGATYSVTNSGASAYTINGNTNPTISLLRGFTYYFAVAASGHPFWIKTAAVTGTGSAYISGVTNNGVDSGTVTFQVPFDAPATLYYICQFHSSMVGTLAVTDTGPAGATGATGATGVGATGATGIQGNIGATGATGIQGNIGLTGATGIQGNIGATGPAGTSANIAVYDETTLVTNAVTGLKFVGAGIAANLVAGNVEVTVTATGTGGSGGGFVYSNTAPATANVGDRWINSETLTSFTYINDGDSSQWIETVTRSSGALNRDLSNLSNIVAINANLTPNADSTINLGAPNLRFKDLYLSGNTLYLGSATLSATGSAINLPAGTTVGGQNVASSGDVSTGGGPKITNLQVATAAWAVLDDTAVDITGGYIIITGTNFVSGALVYFNQTPANSVAFVSATTLRVTVPALTAGTYIVYVINPDGGTAIRVPGLTASASPAWQTGSALAEQYDGVAISLGLVATDAATYTVTSGSLPPGLSLNSNTGVISGTVSGVSVDTTYTFTVTATDAQLQDSPRTFTVTITVSDPYFKLTTLLLSGSALSANTIVRDSSTNNFNITVSGDARASNFTPYGTGWSVYFDGSGDYLNLANNAAFDFGSGEFSFETWFYLTGNGNANIDGTREVTLLAAFPTGGTLSTDYSFGIAGNTTNTGTGLYFGRRSSGTTTSLVYTGTINKNVWYHFAVTRSGSNVTFYLNGSQVFQSTSFSGTVDSGGFPIKIGALRFDGNYELYFPGYISNLRIVKGTAVYTANFTPATTNLTAVANTSLLTCHVNSFRDASTNNFAITRNGDAKVVSFNPFNITNTGVDGSMYFDGTGDYLSAAYNSAFDLGSSNFTLEAWIYTSDSSSNYPSIVGRWQGSGTACWDLRPRSTDRGNFLVFVYSTDGTTATFIDSNGPALSDNAWHHVVAVRSGNNFALFVDGTRRNTANLSGVTIFNSASAPLNVGYDSWGTTYFTGYLSNVRVVKGTAVYDPTQTSLTVPTAPLTAVANTQLLTLQYDQPHNNHTFLDSSSNQFLITRSGNASQGTFSPFSQTGWGNYFSGSGALSIPSSTPNQFGSGDFTIETWYYCSGSIATAAQHIFFRRTTVAPIGLIVEIDGSKLNLRAGDSNVSGWEVNITSTTTLVANTWYHLAVSRSGSSWRLFVNGTLEASATASFTIAEETGNIAVATNIPGYLSNWRVLKGVALYTSNFTVPTTPLTAISGTAILTCQSNRFIDNSSNAFTISTSGSPSVVAFSPFAPTAVYNPAVHGGSAYFDGTGDYLSVGTASNWAFLNYFNVDFTVSFWLFHPSASTAYGILCTGWNSTEVGFNIVVNNSANNVISTFFSRGVSGSQASFDSSANLVQNSWNYVTITYTTSTKTVAFYINGASAGSGSNTGFAYSSSNPAFTLNVGRSIGGVAGSINNLNGYLADLRILNGSIGSTTVPTAPLTAITNTSLLLNFTDAAILDSTGRNAIETVADARTSSVVTKFTGGSMYFDGTGDYLVLPISEALNFQILTTGYTIEAWVYPLSLSGQKQIWYYQNRTNPGSGTSLHITSGTKFAFTVTTNINNSSVDFSAISTVTPVINTWYHVAGVRSGNTVQLYVNGQLDGTATISGGTESFTTHSGDWKPFIGLNRGYDGTLQFYWQGYIADFRITRALRYTANFTAPTVPARLK